MSETNGNVKWPQAATIAVALLSLTVSLALAATGAIRQNEKGCEDRAIALHSRINELQEKIAKNQEDIVQRLARIEAKQEK